MLQGRVSSGFPEQSFPPCLGGGLVQVLERVWNPPPHDLEHSPQSLHSDHFPSTEYKDNTIISYMGIRHFHFSHNAPFFDPQNFALTLFSISLGTAVPRRNEKQRLCKIWRGGWGDMVRYGKCGSGLYHQQVAAHSSFQITDSALILSTLLSKPWFQGD